jgi:hypothetical protein
MIQQIKLILATQGNNEELALAMGLETDRNWITELKQLDLEQKENLSNHVNSGHVSCFVINRFEMSVL